MIITTIATTKIRATTLIEIVSTSQKLVTSFFWTLNPAGISDFHKMCITVMKMYCSKQKPIFINVNSRVLTMMQ